MGLELMVHRATLAQRAARVAELDEGERRRVAAQAARDLDADALWPLVEAHLATRGRKGARVAQRTLDTYELGVRMFVRWAGERAVSLLRPKPDVGFTYARHLEALGYKAASVRVYLAAASHVFAALRWCNATEATPFTDVRAAPDPVPRTQKRKPYPDEDVRQLLKVATPEEAVLVLLGAHAGLRASEIVGVHWRDLHLDVARPFVTVIGKGAKTRDVDVSASLRAALLRWREVLGAHAGERVLPYGHRTRAVNVLKALCGRAGVTYDRRHLHGLRHTAGTRLYQDTHDLLQVREHLGHASVTSTEVYVEYARAEKRSKVSDW